MYPNTKVLMEASIFCPGGTDVLAGSVLELLGNVKELLCSSEVLLALGMRFLHGRTMESGGAGVIWLTLLDIGAVVRDVLCV